MFSTIKELLNEVLDKMQYLYIILTLFCLFIALFSIPDNIVNHPFVRFLFPNSILSGLNTELIIYSMSFYGFLWIIFFIMAGVSHYFPLLFLNSFPTLKIVLEVTASILMIALEYFFIYFKLRGISIEQVMVKVDTIDHPILFYAGVGMPFILLLLTIGNMIYTPDAD